MLWKTAIFSSTEFSDLFSDSPGIYFRNLSSKVLQQEASKQASQPTSEEGKTASRSKRGDSLRKSGTCALQSTVTTVFCALPLASFCIAHWPFVAAWWREHIQFIGPHRERTTVVFVPICGDTGLTRVHPTWAGTYILDACVFLPHHQLCAHQPSNQATKVGQPASKGGRREGTSISIIQPEIK